MAFASISSEDFSGGIYRGREAPSDAVYDAVNALVNDEGQLFRRGGSAYKSTAGSGTLDMLADVFVAGGRRTIFGSEGTGNFYALASDDTTPTLLGLGIKARCRGAALGGVVFLPASNAASAGLKAYGGSRKGSAYSTGTVTVTNGSTTVTGSGTSWSANADAGMLFGSGGSGFNNVVKSVDSNTQITLFNPWTGTTASGQSYELTVLPGATPSVVSSYRGSGTEDLFVATVGQRLLIAFKQRVFVSDRGDPFTVQPENYLDLPSDALITGADAIQNNGVIFTTKGVWALSNLDLDSVDAYGNIQWVQEQISKDVILWGDAGIAGWQGMFVVPCVDDVYLFAPGGPPVPISTSIRPLLRAYVKAGYQPGVATVHRGHYFLPVMNGSTLVDTLVCRLDRPSSTGARPWTRWAGAACGPAYAQRIGGSSRQPLLLGLAGSRVTNLTDCLDPSSSNATDADGSTSDLVIETRDYPTGQQPGFFKNARVRYELTDDGSGATAAPTVAVAFTSDQDAGAFTTLTEKGQQGGGTGWGVSDGSKYQWALVAKKRERGRLRLTVTGACASFVLRSVELLLMPSGKQ